jgi:hypothetical protein
MYTVCASVWGNPLQVSLRLQVPGVLGQDRVYSSTLNPFPPILSLSSPLWIILITVVAVRVTRYCVHA